LQNAACDVPRKARDREKDAHDVVQNMRAIAMHRRASCNAKRERARPRTNPRRDGDRHNMIGKKFPFPIGRVDAGT